MLVLGHNTICLTSEKANDTLIRSKLVTSLNGNVMRHWDVRQPAIYLSSKKWAFCFACGGYISRVYSEFCEIFN